MVSSLSACRRRRTVRTASCMCRSLWSVIYLNKTMKWLPKERRNPFIIVVLSTAALLAIICFGLISSQNATLSTVRNNRKAAEGKLQSMKNPIKNADMTASQLADVTTALSQSEQDMASGDLYSWTYGTIRNFKQQYKGEIPDIGHPEVGGV